MDPASVVRGALGAHPRLADAAATLAGDRDAARAVVADPDAPLRDRTVALAALAVAAARDGVVDPEAALWLDDAPLVDAAIAAGLSGAITGLALALGDALPLPHRRYLARVLAGAGATGLHVATLALAAGEPAFAARAAAAELPTADLAIARRILATWEGAGESFWSALAGLIPDLERFR